jgi:hypothetical protein
VLIMGIPGAGKTRSAEAYVQRGFVRLNRDERGGSLRELSSALDEALASGERRVVLDNTYLTRAARTHVVERASRHRIGVRCVWIDTPLAQAQVNLVERLLDRFGTLPEPQSVREMARREPGIMLPANQMRAYRQLEPPSSDEGFVAVDHVPFARTPHASPDAPGGVFVAASVLARPSWEAAISDAAPRSPYLLFDWRPGATADVLSEDVERLASSIGGSVVSALCPHAAGPPVCWCRPPLPGLMLEFARMHGLDVTRSFVVGAGPAHRTLANTLGATYISV